MLNDLADKSYLSLPDRQAVLKTHQERVHEALQQLQSSGKWACGPEGRRNTYAGAEHGSLVLKNWLRNKKA